MTKIDEVTKVARPYLHVVGETRDDVPTTKDEEIERQLGRLEGRRVKQLLRGDSTDGGTDRSASLYELASLLRDASVTPEVTFHLLQPVTTTSSRDETTSHCDCGKRLNDQGGMSQNPTEDKPKLHEHNQSGLSLPETPNLQNGASREFGNIKDGDSSQESLRPTKVHSLPTSLSLSQLRARS
jgi:hypothetical protein